jgi:hypothetical protein
MIEINVQQMLKITRTTKAELDTHIFARQLALDRIVGAEAA